MEPNLGSLTFVQFITMLTCVVTAVSPGAGTPAGTVTFKDDGTIIGTGTLDASGQATLSTDTLSNGTHVITAEYSGSASYNASTGTLTPDQVIAVLLRLFLPTILSP